MYDGVINIYKEKGYTSHDVVAKMRGILRQKKIGHTGTLDPDAEGVLPVCLGAGTKLCDMLTDRTKTYEAVLMLGRETDTQDAGGKTIAECPVKASGEEIITAVMSFLGDYDQVPPMYSALKVNGKKLCDLARAGVEVERKARPVKILDIRVDEVEPPRVKMTVTCSKGTYIRTLCHDIGRNLGCCGCMESLLRTRVGRFSLEDSVKLEEVERLAAVGTIARRIVSVEEMFSSYPKLCTRPEFDVLVHNGNFFYQEHVLPYGQEQSESPCRVYDSDGRFIGVYRYDTQKRRFQPQKIFPGGN